MAEQRKSPPKIKAVKQCRICGNRDLIPVIDLGVQALSGRFPARGEPDPPKAPLGLVKCNIAGKLNYCGLLQLKHTVPPEEMYSHDYGYRSGINQTMSMHLKGIVRRVQETVDLQPGDVVLDIGSNDATLLRCYEPAGLRKIGIDPTGEQFREYYTADIELVSDYFNSSNYLSVSPDRKVKVITSIAMFYDLETPMAFVRDIREILAPDGIWVFEQSYMPTMLRMNSFDTICHEHLEYYALKQIDWMLGKHNLRILDVEFNDTNGGSFRVYACHSKSALKSNQTTVAATLLNEEKSGLDSEVPYREFKERVFQIKDELYGLLANEKAKGKTIYIYGASTKGNVLLQFCNIDHVLVTAAADRNPEKWGRRTPGTDIPIISEDEARKAKPDFLLVLPWHFRREFLKREANLLKQGSKFIFPLPGIEIF
jgi:NDP-4-keto-2,6-dideoxyhexose 3-C-methyltransferase